jgi:hypothetical protein
MRANKKITDSIAGSGKYMFTRTLSASNWNDNFRDWNIKYPGNFKGIFCLKRVWMPTAKIYKLEDPESRPLEAKQYLQKWHSDKEAKNVFILLTK